MSTSAPTTDGTLYFGTTLRITTEAVEVRDRVYRLDKIKSVRASRIRSNRSEWGLFFSFVVGSLIFLVGTIVFLLNFELYPVGTPVGNIVAASCFLLNLLALVVVISLYRTTMQNWHYIYTATLHSGIWASDIAASFGPQPVEAIIAAVNSALAAEHNADRDAAPGPLYYEEHAIRIKDDRTEIDGRDYSIAGLRYAKMKLISTVPAYRSALSYIGVAVMLTLYNRFSGEASGNMRLVILTIPVVVIFGVLGLTIKVIPWLYRDKGKPLSGAYECILGTDDADDGEQVVFVSVDREYTLATADAVNRKIAAHKAATKQRPSATRSTRSTT